MSGLLRQPKGIVTAFSGDIMSKKVKPEDQPETVGALVPWGGAYITGEEDETTIDPDDVVDDGPSLVPADRDDTN